MAQNDRFCHPFPGCFVSGRRMVRLYLRQVITCRARGGVIKAVIHSRFCVISAISCCFVYKKRPFSGFRPTPPTLLCGSFSLASMPDTAPQGGPLPCLTAGKTVFAPAHPGRMRVPCWHRRRFSLQPCAAQAARAGRDLSGKCAAVPARRYRERTERQAPRRSGPQHRHPALPPPEMQKNTVRSNGTNGVFWWR